MCLASLICFNLSYDALAEHASREEFSHIAHTSRGDLFLLGILLSLVLYVPVVNLLMAVISELTFTLFCLARQRTLSPSFTAPCRMMSER